MPPHFFCVGARKLYALFLALADMSRQDLYWVSSSLFWLKLMLPEFLFKAVSSCFLQLYSGIGGKGKKCPVRHWLTLWPREADWWGTIIKWYQLDFHCCSLCISVWLMSIVLLLQSTGSLLGGTESTEDCVRCILHLCYPGICVCWISIVCDSFLQFPSLLKCTISSCLFPQSL